MSLLEAKSKVHQFLAAPYPPDLEEFPTAVTEEIMGIEVLSSDLQSEADWDLDDFTEGLDLGSRASIHEDYGRLCEGCSVVGESVPSSVADLLSLGIHCMAKMNPVSILQVLFGALESTLSDSSLRVWELQLQLVSKNSEFEAAASELESTERHLRLAENVVRLRWEQVPSEGCQHLEVEEANVAAKLARLAAGSNVQWHTALQSVLQWEAAQLARRLGKLGDEVARLRQE